MGMMYFDEAKIDILKELSINIAKLHDIYGLVVKDEFLINASYLQKVTDSIDQLGAINEKMQRLYSKLADGEKYVKEYICQWEPDYKEDKDSIPYHPKYDNEIERNKRKREAQGTSFLNTDYGFIHTRSVTKEEAELESKWGYNPYEE